MMSYIVSMATTIQVSEDLLNELKNRKQYSKESYEKVIWDLLEDSMELSEETKRHIKKSEEQIKKGETLTLEEVEEKLGLKR